MPSTKYLIQADHPTLKRIDVVRWSRLGSDSFVGVLRRLGYENIKVTETKLI